MVSLHDVTYVSAQMIIDAPADGRRYETVWGELLTTSRASLAHQGAITELLFRLTTYCRQQRIGEACFGPADITWSPDTLVKPDIFVAPLQELHASDDWSTVKTLHLVAEVLSEETARADRFPKRRLYQTQGVETLWLIDIDRARVEVWTPDALFPVIETERLVWHPAGATEPFELALTDLMRFP